MKTLIKRIAFLQQLRIKFILQPNRHLLVPSQQWKHQTNVWNLFKVYNKDTRTTYMTFCCLSCWIWTDFRHCFVVWEPDSTRCNLKRIYYAANCYSSYSPWGGGGGIWRGVKKCGKIEQGFKNVISNFACFLAPIVNIFL